MNNLDAWIDEELAKIAERLPTISHTEPASFSCGFNVGYKQCLLDLADKLAHHFELE